MFINPTLVVNFPPTNQGSVLGTIVSENHLGQILEAIHRKIVLDRALAALRAQRELLFSFTVGKDIERSSGKSALELCWETLERVQYLNRRIDPHQNPEDRIERSGKFYYFLIRVAGIAGGDVAAAKFMNDPRNDCRVRDYLAESERPNYLIETIELPKVAGKKGKRFSSHSSTGESFSSYDIVRALPTEVLPRTVTGLLTNEEYAARHRNDESCGQDLGKLPYWCPTCKQYVAKSHDGPAGIKCEDHLEKLAAAESKQAAKREKTLAEYCAEFKKANNAKLAAKGWIAYSPEAFDIEILSSRGSAMDDVIRQFEKDHSRRLNKWRVQ